MYPPAAFLSRTAMMADELCGQSIRAGETVVLPIYALHRHHMLWDSPNRFDPSRFADPKAIDRFAYLPFGDGAAHLHRGQFCAARGGDHSGHNAGPASLLSRAGKGPEARDDSDSAPRRRSLVAD
jgi:cytochrome P450